MKPNSILKKLRSTKLKMAFEQILSDFEGAKLIKIVPDYDKFWRTRRRQKIYIEYQGNRFIFVVTPEIESVTLNSVNRKMRYESEYWPQVERLEAHIRKEQAKIVNFFN